MHLQFLIIFYHQKVPMNGIVFFSFFIFYAIIRSMTHAPEHKTYAVSLYPDDSCSAQVSSITMSLAETSVPLLPHITLGMFHAKEEDVPLLQKIFKEFAAGLRAFDISFCGADNFCDKVIFLSVQKSELLLNANANLHKKLLPYFEPGGNRNYLPENWCPHIALALKLNKTQFEKAFAAAKKLELPKSAGICRAAIAQCHPYKEIFSINLGSGTDTLTPLQRHKNMAAIRSTGGTLERELRSQLFRFGFRFRKNDKRLTGSPDIVFPHYHAVVFINGCFWHAHGWSAQRQQISPAPQETQAANSFLRSPDTARCDKFRFPKSNQDFWLKKFTRNKERDQKDIRTLTEQGWRVAVVWECSITGRGRKQKIQNVAEKLSLWLEEDFATQFMEL